MTAAIEDLWLFASSVLLIVDDVLCCKVLLVRYHRLPLQFFSFAFHWILLFAFFALFSSCLHLLSLLFFFFPLTHKLLLLSQSFSLIVSIVSSTQCRSVLLTILSIHCSSPWLDFLLSCCFSHYVILTLVFVLHMLCSFLLLCFSCKFVLLLAHLPHLLLLQSSHSFLMLIHYLQK